MKLNIDMADSNENKHMKPCRDVSGNMASIYLGCGAQAVKESHFQGVTRGSRGGPEGGPKWGPETGQKRGSEQGHLIFRGLRWGPEGGQKGGPSKAPNKARGQANVHNGVQTWVRISFTTQ